MSRLLPVAPDLCARVTCLASSLRKPDSRPVSKHALAHLRADPALAGLIDRIGPVKLRPRRLPPFQSLTALLHHRRAARGFARTHRRRDNGASPTFAVLKVVGWEIHTKRLKTCDQLDSEPIGMLHERICMYLNVRSTVVVTGSRPNLFGTLPAVARPHAKSCWERRHPHRSRIWAPPARWARAPSATWGP